MQPSPIAARIAAFHQLPSVTFGILTTAVANDIFSRPPETWTVHDLMMAGQPTDRAAAVMAEIPHMNIEQIGALLQRLNIAVVTIKDPDYPPLLREIASPPPVLYVRGHLDCLHRPALAVVGTRQATSYGFRMAKTMTQAAASTGIVIVSGLARGIDTAAHATAVEAKGVTIAVFGSGIDVIYPWENDQLARRIIDTGGALVSEFPLGAAPLRHHFPQRNRIISGLAKATLLVEAGEKSGALVTAKFALDQNREVLAIPGPVTSPQSVGTNSWLKLGAKVVTQAADILDVFGQTPTADPVPTRRIVATSPDEAAVLPWLSTEPVHVDDLAEKSRLDTSVVSATLLLMEINGQVRHLGGMWYVIGS